MGPRVNFYTNTDDASVGIGAYYRYSFNSHWRIEPSIYVLTEKDSSVDINFDAHYVFQIADWWGVFPQVGIVANDIKDWAVGMSVGAGFDFNVAHRWNISAGLKYEPMFDSDRSNPLVVYVGAAYRFRQTHLNNTCKKRIPMSGSAFSCGTAQCRNHLVL